jgi:hypothetical protein
VYVASTPPYNPTCQTYITGDGVSALNNLTVIAKRYDTTVAAFVNVNEDVLAGQTNLEKLAPELTLLVPGDCEMQSTSDLSVASLSAPATFATFATLVLLAKLTL